MPRWAKHNITHSTKHIFQLWLFFKILEILWTLIIAKLTIINMKKKCTSDFINHSHYLRTTIWKSSSTLTYTFFHFYLIKHNLPVLILTFSCRYLREIMIQMNFAIWCWNATNCVSNKKDKSCTARNRDSYIIKDLRTSEQSMNYVVLNQYSPYIP